jgi:hypothetical protein
VTSLLTYLDSSALVKLVVMEPESTALLTFLAGRPERVSSSVALVEVPRALRRAGCGDDVLERAQGVLGSLGILPVDAAILRDAAHRVPASVRSLDAIHLAAALSLGGFLSEVVTYDERMTLGARALGLTAVGPSS